MKISVDDKKKGVMLSGGTPKAEDIAEISNIIVAFNMGMFALSGLLSVSLWSNSFLFLIAARDIFIYPSLDQRLLSDFW